MTPQDAHAARRNLHHPLLPLLPYGQGAAEAQGRRLHRNRPVACDGAARGDDRARERTHDGAADLHRQRACRRLRRTARAGARRQARSAARGERRRPDAHERRHVQSRDDPDALGAYPRRQSRRGGAADRRGEVGRRRLRADAGDDQHHGRQARAAVGRRRRGRRRHLARHLPRAGAQARHLSSMSVRWRSRSRPTAPPTAAS